MATGWTLCFAGKQSGLERVGVSDLPGLFFEDMAVESRKGSSAWEFRWAVRCNHNVLQPLTPLWLKAVSASSYRVGRSVRGSYTSAANWRDSVADSPCPRHPIRPPVFFLTRPVDTPGTLPRVAAGRSALHELARVALSEPDPPMRGESFVDAAVDHFARDPLAFGRFIEAVGYIDSVLSVLDPPAVCMSEFQRNLLSFVREFPVKEDGPRSDESLDAFLNGPRSSTFMPLLGAIGGIVSSIIGM